MPRPTDDQLHAERQAAAFQERRAKEIDTTNRFLVGTDGIGITFPLIAVPRRLSKADALNLAAWLVALADDGNEFPALLEAVNNT
jgi:hypothetical protein